MRLTGPATSLRRLSSPPRPRPRNKHHGGGWLAPRGATMSSAIENLQEAQQRALSIRPKAGGFPVLAEVLRQAGVRKNQWFLPAGESLYLTDLGPVVSQGEPLVSGLADVPAFDREAVIHAIRTDQAGESTFPE